jgi:hypothetical protein
MLNTARPAWQDLERLRGSMEVFVGQGGDVREHLTQHQSVLMHATVEPKNGMLLQPRIPAVSAILSRN